MSTAQKLGIDTRPLPEREAEMVKKISATEHGPRVIELLRHMKPEETMTRMIIAATLGEALWNEYWALHCAKVEADMANFFERLASDKAHRTTII
jgi:tRNA isopentenyl-2-thiomethyl-A-37 hydroxylase MiaE